MHFQRTYANGGAGTSQGFGHTQGDVSYVFGRVGTAFHVGTDEIAISGEFGHEKLDAGSYAEAFGPSNPFNATFYSSMDGNYVAKARAQITHQFTDRIDTTLYIAGVYGFNTSTNISASVPGFGNVGISRLGNLFWTEYGARVGYAVTKNLIADLFVDGVSGDRLIGTRVHGGAGIRYRF
jgi:hypothetical protein